MSIYKIAVRIASVSIILTSCCNKNYVSSDLLEPVQCAEVINITDKHIIVKLLGSEEIRTIRYFGTPPVKIGVVDCSTFYFNF